MPSKIAKIPTPVNTHMPEYSASGSMTFTSVVTSAFQYIHSGKMCQFSMSCEGTVGGTPGSSLYFTLPLERDIDFRSFNYPAFACYVFDNSAVVAGVAYCEASRNKLVTVRRYDGAAYTAGTVQLYVSGAFVTETEAASVRTQLEEDVRQLEIRVSKSERTL